MSNYNYNTLCHHGIKGQKWGIRRFQNEDGTLTAEGRKRYGIENGIMSEEGKKLYEKDHKQLENANKGRISKKKAAAIGAAVGAALGIASTVQGVKADDGVPRELQLKAGIISTAIAAVAGAGVGTLIASGHNKKISKGEEYVKKLNNLSIT